MNRRVQNAVGIVILVLALLLPQVPRISAQATVTLDTLATKLETLSNRIENVEFRIGKQGTRLHRLESQVEDLERKLNTPTPTPRPTPTRTPRPTRKPTPTPKPRPTLNPAAQAALDESTAYEWVNQAIKQLSREKGVDARKGGWMIWYDGQNMVNVFMYILDQCDYTGEEMVALIEKYERDKLVIGMNAEYEPKLTNEVAIFRDFNRAAGNNYRPCTKLIEQFKELYKKEQE